MFVEILGLVVSIGEAWTSTYIQDVIESCCSEQKKVALSSLHKKADILYAFVFSCNLHFGHWSVRTNKVKGCGTHRPHSKKKDQRQKGYIQAVPVTQLTPNNTNAKEFSKMKRVPELTVQLLLVCLMTLGQIVHYNST